MKNIKKFNIFRYLIIIILIIIFCFSLYKVISHYKMVDRHNKLQNELIEIKDSSVETDDSNLENKILSKYQSLYEINNDLVGWIKIPNTNIDYPVVYSKTKDYYLKRDFYKKYDATGTIYVSEKSDIFKPSDNVVIYGHNSFRKYMFAQLEKYQKYDFYKNNKYIYLDTLYEENKYEIVSVFKIVVKNNHDTDFRYYNYIDFNDEEEFNSYLKEIKNRSLYKINTDVNYGDKLITLSTCDQTEVNGRIVVIAKKVN